MIPHSGRGIETKKCAGAIRVWEKCYGNCPGNLRGRSSRLRRGVGASGGASATDCCREFGGRTWGAFCERETGHERKSGGETRTSMKYGFRPAQLSACCLVSKNRSMTSALRSWAVRPERRAALRLTTAEPVSTASKGPSGSVTLLPYGIRRGSTAQCPARKRAPVEQMWRRVQRSEPPPPLAQYTVTRATIDCSTAETAGVKSRTSPTAKRKRFIITSDKVPESRGSDRSANGRAGMITIFHSKLRSQLVPSITKSSGYDRVRVRMSGDGE